MATLVLSAAGRYLGGPIGQVIGATIGNYIDREVLFKPKGREGPRLTELAVQTSSYGTQIPKLFGTIRVAGSVIWSTDLIEHRTRDAGKGRPTVTNYSYTASLAVALSARAVLGVARIWADGKLLRGAAGDFKAGIGAFRLHVGSEDQDVDPLIVAAEGAGQAPAHRGIAYAVFEDLQLADFGNRIPSLTFEVQADAGAVAAGAVVGEIAGGDISCPGETQLLGGFSAYGASVRAVVETLAGADGGWFASVGDSLELSSGSGESVTISDSGVSARERAGARGDRSIAAADSAPRTLTLAHYDPARDYQIGVQRATRPGTGTRAARLELPAVLEAGAAKTIAERALARLDAERERRTLALGWDALALAPGARVRIDGVAGLWRVDRAAFEAMVVTLDCVALSPETAAVAASGGRVLPAPDVALGQTIVEAFELPPLDGSLASAPRLAVAAAGTEPGWRSAALLLSLDGVRWDSAGGTALPAVIGTMAVPPGRAPAGLADRVSTIEVDLAHATMTLGDADDAALDSGANLAMAGDELLQFAEAEPLGANRWRLRGLWRGRRGTEAAISTQAAGDRFVLISADSLRMIELPAAAAAAGSGVQLLAEGPGDTGGPAEAMAAISGLSVVPPSPVHLAWMASEDGGAMVRWVRRSRAGWRWIDGIDAPLGEEAERYQVAIAPEAGAVRVLETEAPIAAITAGERAAAVLVTVRQAGSHGLSAPAAILLPALD
ncbi:MAG: phage tail protein [Pseudomonadota bacterium]